MLAFQVAMDKHRYEIKGVREYMSDSFVGVFSMGAMAGMFLAVVIELITVMFIERIEDKEQDEEPEEDKDAELKALAKKLNVKIGE